MIDLDDRLIITTELPDVMRDDIDLRLEDRDLVISGARHDEDEVKDDDPSRKNPVLGSFLRRIPMPFVVTTSDVHANFDDSVLRVEVRKPAAAKPDDAHQEGYLSIDALDDVVPGSRHIVPMERKENP